MTMNVEKMNLNSHGILLNPQEVQQSPVIQNLQPVDNNTPPTLPTLQPRNYEHNRTPYPQLARQESHGSQWRGQADGSDRDFQREGPEVRGINAIGTGPRSRPQLTPDGVPQEVEDMRQQQLEQRRQYQRERLREPRYNQLGMIRQELENQQFQVQNYQGNQNLQVSQQVAPQGQIRDQPRPSRIQSLQDQISNVDQHLQENQRRRAVSFSHEYQEMKTQSPAQNQGQMQRRNGV